MDHMAKPTKDLDSALEAPKEGAVPRPSTTSGHRKIGALFGQGHARDLLARILVAAIVGAGAIVLGTQATALPTFSLGSSSADVVEIWSSVEGDEVFLFWEMGPSGEVSVQFGRSSSAGNAAPEYAEIVVVLACDTRLTDIEEEPVYMSSTDPYTVTPHGDPAGCQPLDEPLGDRELEYQLIRATLGKDQNKRLHGKPLAEWTQESAGIRTARTPSIYVAANLEESHFPELRVIDVIAPQKATLNVSLTATPDEVVDSLSGPGPDVREETSNHITDWGDGGWVESVHWQLEHLSAGGMGVINPGVAEWRDPVKITRAQWQLLLCGLFLGVALSLVVEQLVPRADSLRPFV